ncbi:MAG: N-acetylmuramoyl-L-alanine amidase [Spartobacteria bacterium]
MRTWFYLALAFSVPVTFVGEDWAVTKQQGRDYVTFTNLARFYSFPEYIRVSRTVSLRSERRGIRAQAGTSQLYINGVKFLTDFPILTNGSDELVSAMDVSKLIEPIIRPHRIKNAHKIDTVVLDPGHGGMDNGASNRWGSEKTFTLDVALKARTELVAAGYKVEMTRSSDKTLTLDDRVNFANKFPNAVFVSIHFNWSGAAEGIETYALAPAGVVSNAAIEKEGSFSNVQWCPGNAEDEKNIALGAAVHASVLSRLSMFDRGVKHARFHVLRKVKIPGVLVECGFLSSSSEGQRIATTQFRQQVGSAIAQAVKNYDSAVNFRAEGQTFASAKLSLPIHSRSISEPLTAFVPNEPIRVDKPSVSISGGE